MKLTKTQRFILFALGQFYHQLNQPLIAKPIKVRTSKIAFITFLSHSSIVIKQQRALYKNLETLENKELISYGGSMITFTPIGLEILDKINKEVNQFLKLKEFCKDRKSKKEIQTIIKES